MSVTKGKRINWKIAIIPVWAVLVIVGTMGSYLPGANAQSNTTKKYDSFAAEWQVEYDYRLNPNAQDAAFYLKYIKVDGFSSNGSGTTPIKAGDEFDTTGYNGVIQGIYFGLSRADVDWANGPCEAGCNFSIYEAQTLSGNPVSPTLAFRVPINKFPERDATGPQRYKVIPVINLTGPLGAYTDISFDSGSQTYFTITWDASAPSTYNDPGTRIQRPVAVTGRSQFRAGGESGSTVAGILISVVNTVLVAVLTVVVGGVEIIYSLLVGPIIRAMLGGTPEFIAANIPPFVEYGWVYVRDVMNLLFILVLIFAGVATMLHIGEYGLKKTITRVIIVALAVNFSLLAGQIVLNFAQIMMNTFINPTDVDLIRQNIDFSRVNIWDLQAGDALQGTAMLLFHIIYEIGVVAVLGAIAIFLLIRLTAVWLLLILAPAAYILYLFEPTEEYLSQWWHKFVAYAFFAPIMAFFLAIISKLAQSGYFGNGQIEGAASISNGVTAAMQGAMLIVMLWGTLYFASKMGIAGADTVVHGAQSAWKTGFGIGGWSAGKLGGLAARKWNETTAHLLEARAGKPAPGFMRKAAFAVLNPAAFARGWATRTEELEHLAHGLADARGREVAEQLRTGGQLKVPYAQFEERKHENEYLKDYQGMSKEKMMRMAVELENLSGLEGEVRRRSLIKAAAAGGYLDDILRMKHFANKYAEEDGTVYSAKVLNRFLYSYLGDSEQSMRFMDEDLEELGKKTRHFEYLGHAQFDPQGQRFERGMKVTGQKKVQRGVDKDGKAVYVEIDDLENNYQGKYAASEFDKTGGRERIAAAPHNFAVIKAEVDADGAFVEDSEELEKSVYIDSISAGEIDEFNRQMLEEMDVDVVREAQHAQGRMTDWLISAKKYDETTGQLKLTDGEYKKIMGFWKTNPDFVAALFAKLQDREPRSALSEGIRMKVEGKDKAFVFQIDAANGERRISTPDDSTEASIKEKPKK